MVLRTSSCSASQVRLAVGYVPGRISMGLAVYLAKASNSTANWEITELFKKRVATPCNGGKLPDGTQTVTVAGGVYSDEEVNYWLYGVLGEMLGWDAGNILELIVAYRKGSWGGTGIPGRLAWFMAGYQNDMTLPANWSVNLDLITTYHYSSIFGVSVNPVRLWGRILARQSIM